MLIGAPAAGFGGQRGGQVTHRGALGAPGHRRVGRAARRSTDMPGCGNYIRADRRRCEAGAARADEEMGAVVGGVEVRPVGTGAGHPGGSPRCPRGASRPGRASQPGRASTPVRWRAKRPRGRQVEPRRRRSSPSTTTPPSPPRGPRVRAPKASRALIARSGPSKR